MTTITADLNSPRALEMLADSIQRDMDDELSRFVGHDRGVALSLLAWLGLRYYSKVHPDQHLDLQLLQRLIGRYAHEIHKEDARGPPAPRSGSPERKGRPDSMAHYPFTDPSGTVPEVLKGGYSDRPNLLDMGVPGRKRYVEKVFEEMRFARGGIRLSDLPEALDRIGIRISPQLRRVLERTRSMQTDGPLDAEDDQDNDFFRFHYMEKYITIAQWKAIVQRFLKLIRDGKDPSKLADILPRPSEPGHQHRHHGHNHGHDQADDWEWEEQGQQEDKHEQQGSSDYSNDHQHQQRRPQSRRNKQSKRVDLDLANRERRYQQRLKHVPARISEYVHQDRQHFHHHQNKQSTAAKQVVANKRVHEFVNNLPWGLFDPQSASDRIKPARLPRDIDLSSGRSAMEIADAFLQGPVGRELLSSDDRYMVGYGEDDISPRQAQAKASQMLGLSPPPRPISAPAPAPARMSIPSPKPHAASPTTSGSQFAFKPASEREAEKQREKDAAPLYSSQWKSSKGGWVADFGPKHTHTAYTGSERSPTSRRAEIAVEDRQQGGGVIADEMLYHMARDLITVEVKSTSSRQYSDHSSVDTATAGAGAGADDDYLNMQMDEDLLAGLQGSMALKDAVSGSSRR